MYKKILLKLGPRRRLFKAEIAIVLILILSPFLFYAYLIAPEYSQVWNIGFISIRVQYFSDVQMFFWNVGLKLIPMIFLLAWFFSDANWWKPMILIPFSLLLYQLLVIFLCSLNITDYSSIFYYLPFLILVFTILLKLSSRFKLYKNNLEGEIQAFIEAIFSKKIIEKSQIDQFLALFGNKDTYFERDYLKKLIEIQESPGFKVKAPSNDVIYQETGLHNFLTTLVSKKPRAFELVIIIILLLSPLWFYYYLLFPNDILMEAIPYYADTEMSDANLQMMLWFLSNKLLVFICLCIWFFTNKNWWKYAILIPLTVVLYQIDESFNIHSSSIDEHEIFRALPVIIPILVFIIWLSTKFSAYVTTMDIKARIDTEVEKIINRHVDFKIKQSKILTSRLNRLRDKRKYYSPEVYMSELVKLRKELE